MAGHGKGRKGSHGGSRGRGRGGSRGGSRRSGGNYSGRGRRNNSFLSKVEDDIDKFTSHGRLSDDFISLRDRRENAPIVKLNKKLKISKLQQINDMVDLNRGDFNGIEEMSINSMMYQQSTRRKKNTMYNEVRYTNNHREELLNKSFRKLSIEFVKAKEIFDPSKLLLDKLAQNNKFIPENTKLPSIVDIEEEIIKENELYQGEYDGNDDNNNTEGEEEEEELSQDGEIEDFEGEIEFDHDNSDMEIVSDEEGLNSNNGSDISIQHNPEDDNQSNITLLEKDELNEQIQSPKMNFQQFEKKIKKSKVQFIDDNDEETFDLIYDENFDESEEDDESDDGMINSNDLDNEDRNNDYDDDYDDIIKTNLEVTDDEFDDASNNYGTMQIGKFMTSMKTTKNGETFIELPQTKRTRNAKLKNNHSNKSKSEKTIYVASSGDNMNINDVVKHVNKTMYSIGEDEVNEEESKEEEEEEPEFGFLEEDYVSFDVTNIKIENIRVSSDINNQQYYIQAPSLFGFDDFQWFSRNDFLGFLTENGFPEHRFNAFMKNATAHLVDPRIAQAEEKFDEDDIYISDSSGDNEENYSDNENNRHDKGDNYISFSKNNEQPQISSDPGSDSELDEDLMEGIEDLLIMHQNSSISSHFDPLEVGTKSIKIKGRRKNPQLEFNTEVDPEVQKFLTEKYLNKKGKRKDQKEEREFARKNNAYMLVKYPYLLEMEDILNEFKEFWKDPIRESLRFPPMDFHVNMVLKMIAEAYGYSTRKIGKGKKEYLEARKPRKNKNREPHWDRLKKLANKRNICYRMDVDLSREEKRELKRLKGGNVAVEQMRNKGRGNFSYKEGEVVGANAKEIDSSSIGRKLLEKMGWQQGDALGPGDNKGIVEPIKVVVKTSKKGIR